VLIFVAGHVSSIPASQALRASASLVAATALRTGLTQLDEALALPTYGALGTLPFSQAGGIPRGHITEVYGPPAVGKTALA
jgi:RecA/RadA recombinase